MIQDRGARDRAFAPATSSRAIAETRLVVVRAKSGEVSEEAWRDLPTFFDRGDVVVVNDAATIPSSVFATVNGAAIELRLLALPDASNVCDAVVFGAGDWHTPTEHRPPPPALSAGDVVLAKGLEATVMATSPAEHRVTIRFAHARAEVIAALYRVGKPVQYAHIRESLALWDIQNVYAAEPWAAEMPSAGRPLNFGALDALAKRGVIVARLTHGAGLSSIGDAALDSSLPWIERYRIPEATVRAVLEAKREGRRVIAVGTSVVRALEASSLETGEPHSGESTTTLRIDARHRLAVARSLLTGMHDGATSHADLLSAFASPALLARASAFAADRGFVGHELGDSCLILDA